MPLIEKAYAKIHNCYEALISGFIDDALSDLTGFVAEKIRLHDANGIFPNKAVVKMGGKDAFWDYLSDRCTEGCLMGCSATGETEKEVVIDGEHTGILSNHAYGIVDVIPMKIP